MANYATLKGLIDQYITTNGQGEITGAILNDVLKGIVNSIGAGYLFGGVVVPSSNVGTPDQNVFFIATQGGSYQHFNETIIPDGITIFKWNGNWSHQILFAGDGGVFDISAYHNGAKYADLTAALGTNGANVPEYIQKGGISVKFVQSSDNRYVQYRLMSDTFDTTVTNWQGLDVRPVTGSVNPVMSGGVKVALNEVNELINGATVSYPSGSSGVSRDASRQYFSFDRTGSYRVTCVSVGGASSGRAQLYIMLNGEQQLMQTFDEGETLLIENIQGDYVELYTSTGVAGGRVEFFIENITENARANAFINIKELILDQGGVSVSSGVNVDSPYFVRTKMLSVADATFCTDKGYIIRGYAKYNRSTGEFVEFIPVNGRFCTVHDCMCRISIRKVTDNTEITPEEVMLESFLIDVKKDNLINLNRFGYSQGFITTSDGGEGDSSMYIRTRGYLNVQDRTIFVCDEPFLIRGYAVYVNGTFSRYVAVDDSLCEIENCVCRVVVRNKVADTPITPADFMLDNEILFNTNINLHSLCFSQGHIYTVDGGDDSINPNYIRTDFLNIDRTSYLYCDSNFLIRGYAIYDEYHHFVSYVLVNNTSTQVPRGIYRVVVRKSTDNTSITPSEFMKDSALDNTEDISMLPIAHYNYDTALLDVTAELSGIDMEAVDSLGCFTFQEQIYAKFDALVSAHPDIVEKIDLGTFTELSYPLYANLNGSPSGSYLSTPSYKTYMYKIAYKTTIANVGRTANKRKIFVVAGLHGWENASQLNTYIVASMICKAACEDWYALASMYDFYFVPCLNGYGAYHDQRVNANGVDLNRNFPAFNWAISGEGTQQYSGSSAASEFETQLVIKAVELLKPDIFIDHHSYGAPVAYTFYVEPASRIERDMCYTNLYAWNHRAYKDYPNYFGTTFDVHPNAFNNVSSQTSNSWAKNAGVALSSTIEVCLGISYINGQIATQSQAKDTYWKEPIVKLNELMLRLCLLRYSEYELKNGVRTIRLNPALLI